MNEEDKNILKIFRRLHILNSSRLDSNESKQQNVNSIIVSTLFWNRRAYSRIARFINDEDVVDEDDYPAVDDDLWCFHTSSDAKQRI